MAVSVRQAKALLRKDMKTKLSAVPDRLKVIQSQIVTKKVLALPVFQTSRRVSVYLSMKSEVSTDALVQHVLNSNKACFIPRYDGVGMSMVRLASWQDYQDLPETKWKIKQPPVDEVREDALDSGGLDVILTPGVAFTPQGVRCGHGKGYYDNYLRQCEERGHRPVTVALAFREQICADIPATEADRNIDYVIYPTSTEIQDALKDVT
ncbi:5-formyltetrahydrofolate cyclo-ligase-like [Haliotis cracherodii]|uniref:5-formyltetrahydrofolate cyclo-ligase-like n=1 Tax=Haliotis cracherodii TaxID=6455 RepID=UPI0039EBEFE0